MELKEYQQTVLDMLDLYLDELRTQLAKADKIQKANRQMQSRLHLATADVASKKWFASQ